MSDRETECTCDELAHPCEIHDTSGSPDVVRGAKGGPEWRDNVDPKLIVMNTEGHKKPRGMDLAMRVGHLKLQRWLKALSEGGCLACPDESSGSVGCLTCPGNRQDCECYEHAGDGPDDDQLRELLEMWKIQAGVNTMLENQAKIKSMLDEQRKAFWGVLPVTYIQGVDGWTEERVEEDSEEEPCTHEVTHMGRCAGCSAQWNGEDEGWIVEKQSVLSTKMSDMEVKLKSGGGFNAKLMLVDDQGPSVGWITEEEDYRLEKDPVERLRKKHALFAKVYGWEFDKEGVGSGGECELQHSLMESYMKARENMLSEKETRRESAMQAAMEEDDWGQKLSDLPDGRYYIKDPTDPSAFTRPIDVSAREVTYLGPKSLKDGALPKLDPIAQAQMAAYATVGGKAFQEAGLEKDEEEKGKKKWNLSRGMRRLLKKRVLRKKAS